MPGRKENSKELEVLRMSCTLRVTGSTTPVISAGPCEPLMADIAFACSLNQATGVVSEDVVSARFDVSLSAASVYLTPALCSLIFAYCMLNRFTHLKWKKRPL